MFRVFLADEDATARESIRNLLSAEPGGFKLVGEASDGAEALPVIRDVRPDILIAGLRMPFMDGPALCRAVRRDFPWVQQMLIGGNDGLEYARSAQVEGEYLLRPFSRYELFEALERMGGRLKETRRSLRERIARAEANVTAERREAERRFCEWVLAGNEETFVHRMHLERTARGRYCRVLTVEPGDGASAGIVRGILRLLELEPGHSSILAAIDMKDALAVTVSGDVPEKVEDDAYAVAYTVMSASEYFTGARARIQVGACVDNLDDLQRSFAALAGLRAVQTRRRPVFGAGDALRERRGEEQEPCLLGECLLCLDAAELREQAARFMTVGYLNAGHVRQAVEALEHELGAGCEVPEELENDPVGLLDYAVRWRAGTAPELEESPLTRARRYVVRNFGNPGLQVFNAAACAGMAPNRFRQVFHQETGRTFTEYLFALRVNAAKALLVGTRMRVSGIAQRVGFSDANYFSNVFLHMVGVSPKEYREKMV